MSLKLLFRLMTNGVFSTDKNVSRTISDKLGWKMNKWVYLDNA